MYLHEQGYSSEILELAQRGKYVIGICGGYQMLGRDLLDPDGSEADIGSQKGLGLLPCTTTFGLKKSTHLVEAEIKISQGIWESLKGQSIKGYEIHMGTSHVFDEADLLEIKCQSSQEVCIQDGACDSTGRIFGTYLHGIFDNTNIMLALINNLRTEKGLFPIDQLSLPAYKRQNRYDQLAEIVRNSVDMEKINAILKAGGC
jgi:adenosylcobyric acid synthase